MTLESLQAAKIAAMKNKDIFTRDVLSAMIDACQKASITPKGRIKITEQLVDETLIKYQKTIQEMIDTCPADRVELMGKYTSEMEVVKQYAPQLITDKEVIKGKLLALILSAELTLEKKNKGSVMKIASSEFKGMADMKIVNQIVGEILVY